MNMANRNDSDVRQHETLPGPGPGPNRLPPGVRPVEQMVDAAIERIAREHGLSHVETSALSVVTPIDEQIRDRPTRLRWKGLDVSDEFRAYAERVARGEDLPPFEGRVLAEPNASFPWGKGSPRTPAARVSRTGGAAWWSSAIAVLGLLGWSVAMKLEAANVSGDELGPAAVQAELALQAAPRVNDVASVAGDAVIGDVVVNDVVVNEIGTGVSGSDTPALPEGSEVAASSSAPSGLDVAPLHAALAPVAAEAAIAPVVPAAPAASVKPAVAAPAAAAAMAAPAAVAAIAAPAAVPRPAAVVSPAVAPPVAAAPAKPLVDEFGIMVDGPSTSSQAKSALGSVGDLARAGQAPGGNVRKEPGGESSAKGVLLVETPSF